MTREEFSDQFDVLLGSYSRTMPFGDTLGKDIHADEYEKSVCLTTAEKELVEDWYNGKTSSQFSFEEKEEMREALDTLVEIKENTQPLEIGAPAHLTYPGKTFTFFPLPDNLMYIIYEQATFSCKKNACIDGRTAVLVPTTHDELWYKLQNPFRGPSKDRCLRLNATDNIVEIVSDYPIGAHVLRYIRTPQPIILTDLPEGLSIDGKSEAMGCELPAVLHHKVLERAVVVFLRSRAVQSASSGQSNN